MTKLIVTRPWPEAVFDAATRDFDVIRWDKGAPLSEAEAAEALAEAEAIMCTVGDAFRGGAFDAAVRAKVLANVGVGYNHLDLEAAKTAGVTVTNTPEVVTEATADLAVTLLLMTLRRAAEGERLVRSGAWTGWAPMQLLGTHVTGKRLGLVGMGRIGQAVAQRAHQGFGMEVGYWNRSAKDLPFPAERFDDLGALLQWARVVVLAVPATPETHHLIGAEELRALGPEGYLVNIARGDVVAEEALIAALQSGGIAGAGLDVYEQEPHVPEALRALDAVTLLPHLGTSCEEVRAQMGLRALSNIRQALAGEVPQDRLI